MTNRERSRAVGSQKLHSRAIVPQIFGGTSSEEAGLFLHDSLSHPKLPWKRAALVPCSPRNLLGLPAEGTKRLWKPCKDANREAACERGEMKLFFFPN